MLSLSRIESKYGAGLSGKEWGGAWQRWASCWKISQHENFGKKGSKGQRKWGQKYHFFENFWFFTLNFWLKIEKSTQLNMGGFNLFSGMAKSSCQSDLPYSPPSNWMGGGAFYWEVSSTKGLLISHKWNNHACGATKDEVLPCASCFNYIDGWHSAKQQLACPLCGIAHWHWLQYEQELCCKLQ